jgi:hypothetical protein
MGGQIDAIDKLIQRQNKVVELAGVTLIVLSVTKYALADFLRADLANSGRHPKTQESTRGVHERSGRLKPPPWQILQWKVDFV